MAKIKLTIEEQRAALRTSIENSLAEWNHLNTEGGCDPSWSDGVNLNLVRNHIIYFTRQLDELDDQPRQLSFFSDATAGQHDYQIPPEVPNDYMAQKERIVSQAEATAHALETLPDYRVYLQLLDSAEIPKGLCFYDEAKYIRQAIKEGDYVTMRRYRDTEYRLNDVRRMISRLREFPKKASAA